MTKSKNTKRALLASILSMMLCTALLIGSTFAWFTDSVTSGRNQIVAGNLDVAMDYAVLNADGSFKEWKTVDSETALFDENTLWEPGYTQVVYLKVRNVGSLSLNYKLLVDIANEKPGVALDENGEQVSFKLSDYLTFGAIESSQENFFVDRDAARAAIGENAGKLKSYSATGSIKASEKETDIKYVTLVVYMPETVGNEANHISGIPAAIPSIDLGIKLEATQMVDEKDGFGTDYDKNASQTESTAFDDLTQESFTVSAEADLLKFADLARTNDFKGKIITLANDIVLNQANWTPIGTTETPFAGTFDGAEHVVSGLKITEDANGLAGFFGTVNGATIKNLTVEGDITLSGSTAKMIAGICAQGNNSTVIESCTNKVNINISAVTITDGEIVAVGGIVSGIDGTVNKCHNNGNINAEGVEALAGGITAINGWGTTLTEVTNDGTISGMEGLFGEIVAIDYKA